MPETKTGITRGESHRRPETGTAPQCPLHIRGPRHWEACSRDDQQRIESLFRNWQVIFL